MYAHRMTDAELEARADAVADELRWFERLLAAGDMSAAPQFRALWRALRVLRVEQQRRVGALANKCSVTKIDVAHK